MLFSGKKMVLSVTVLTFLLTGCCISHEWVEATCTTPKTCSKCGKTEGEMLGHNWAEATCQKPKTCKVCGATEGNVLEHNWIEATCQAPKTCKACGATEGDVLEHNWTEATCQTPKTCKACGLTEGDVLEHDWAEATCQAPRTCKMCGLTDGTVAEHKLNSYGSCEYCGETIGFALNSTNYKNYIGINDVLEPIRDRRINKSYKEYIKTEPIKNVKFHNVVITYEIRSEYVSEGSFYVTVQLDEYGYGKSNEIYTNSKKGRLLLDSISGFVIE